MTARIELVEELGSEQFVYCSADVAVRDGRIVVRVDHRREFTVGESLGLIPDAGELHWFDAESGVRL